MRRWLSALIVAAGLAALTFACFGGVLFRGEQFIFRDAGHFYYPLYQRVQAEWEAGRWPLWEPEENAGMPLMGNPTAAVLYPGKLIFAVTPYPVGAKLYVIAHTLLAFGAMLALCRSWGTSRVGSALGAFGYAFGAPVLFQYCNIIYLVGAAWLPLGFLAADRWLRLGRRLALPGLAVVLAMETLGGDPESAYLTGLAAAGYALALAWSRGRALDGRDRPASGWAVAFGVVLALAAWVVVTLLFAKAAPALRPPRVGNNPTEPFAWMRWVSPAVAAVWASAGLWVFHRWRRRRQREAGPRPVFLPMLVGLAAAAAVAAMASAAQLLPVLEFTGQSGRAAGGGTHDIYPFSLEPVRVVELLWPNVFGTPYHGNKSWQGAVPHGGPRAKVWVPSIYVGGLTLALGLASAGLWRGRPWVRWMTAVAAAGLVIACGEYTSPVYWARHVPAAAKQVGRFDPDTVAAIRSDGYLRDGDGSAYWALATVLPGFKQFRFPSKALTFSVMALAALAGAGWDGLTSGDRRARFRVSAWSSVMLALSLAALAAGWAGRGTFVGWLESKSLVNGFGPFDARGAFAEMQAALAQGALVAGAMLALAVWARGRPGRAAALSVAVMAADLAAANARFVLTGPQSLLEGVPEIARVIREDVASRPDPDAQPYRVHRMPIWSPRVWSQSASNDRVRDFVEWERATIQPKYAINDGVQYTMTLGVAELYDYEWFFGGFMRKVDAEGAQLLRVETGREVVVYPRRAFDLWNSRYFVLPYHPGTWTEEDRGFASFLDRTERIYPHPDAFKGPDAVDRELAWINDHDVQIRRNLDAFPRAWVVHEARGLRPIYGLSREGRALPMQEILFANEPFWRDATRTVYDPRLLAWIETDNAVELAGYLPGGPPLPAESVKVRRYESDRVELEAKLDRPGVVVLSDVYYPGWTLTIDGKPATVYRVNRLMRGAAVPSGPHTLVYAYNPRSFRVGLVVSGFGLAALALSTLAFLRAPVSPDLAPEPDRSRPANPTDPDLP